MPKRTDIHSILILGSGPIVIGQACEFDYAGVQACYALKEEGYRVVLLNSNPATIMTDPDLTDAVYIEPLRTDIIERIIAQENIDAILPTMGGQTALNLAMSLHKQGILERLNVKIIGACPLSIEKAENRQIFHQCMRQIGLNSLKGYEVSSWVEAMSSLDHLSFPLIIRPSFTLGGMGGGIAHNQEEFDYIVKNGLHCSPITQVLIEESALGWKEYEIEVVRDSKDQCIAVCSIENVDPMGIHTGDSITVAPALTLTDKEYQQMRQSAFAVIREVGITTGGANVQFAVNPQTGHMVVIEMNPRVSRSSALASKATGFPIAKVAAKLAVGYTLDELPNEITQVTPASFEPSIDYVVTKIPRFDFEKFEGVEPQLSTYMQSVGEIMSIGRTFAESLQKGLRSLDRNIYGLKIPKIENLNDQELKERIAHPHPDRIFYIAEGLRKGIETTQLHLLCKWDPWFLKQIEQLILVEQSLIENGLPTTSHGWHTIKALGFSDAYMSEILQIPEEKIRNTRNTFGVRPVFRRIDTCAGEFSSKTAYLYSTFLPYPASVNGCESEISDRKKVIIIGSGPNRIGQGLEFDYCCVHASFALKQMGIESIMVNCNPETVSTDHTTSDRLYFSPVILEDVLEIIHIEKKKGTLLGIFVQFGGQTALKLAKDLAEIGVPLLGTAFEDIHTAEDRHCFSECLASLGLHQPHNLTVHNGDELEEAINKLGYPVILRPSYVLGGRGMQVLHCAEDFEIYFQTHSIQEFLPILVEEYLEGAIEVDVDALYDGEWGWIAGIMEHFEPLGIHSGDSACVLPPVSLSQDILFQLKEQTLHLAKALKVKGHLNVQFAIYNNQILVIEANPRASRTVPYVSKTLGIPVAQIAAKISLGARLDEFDLPSFEDLLHFSVKQPVFSFNRFKDISTQLGPIMKSTGEVMGISSNFEEAIARGLVADLQETLTNPSVAIFIHSAIEESHKSLWRSFLEKCSKIVTDAATLEANNFLKDKANLCSKDQLLSSLSKGEIDILIILDYKEPNEKEAIYQAAHKQGTPIYTTFFHVRGVLQALTSSSLVHVKSLQEYYQEQKDYYQEPKRLYATRNK